MTTHTARAHLERASQRMPGIWGAIESVRAGMTYPPGVYVDMPTVGAAFVKTAKKQNCAKELLDHFKTMSGGAIVGAVMPFATLATWRMTQGIYRFDPALYAALITTPLTGDLPNDVLHRLPEWCVYIETPGLHIPTKSGILHQLIGAFVRLDYDNVSHDSAPSLAIGLDIAGSEELRHHYLPLHGSLSESIDYTMSYNDETDAKAKEYIYSYLEPLVNLLLYLCAGSADIEGPRSSPGNPAPKKTRRGGERLFAADGPAAWDVGVRMGAALRRAYHAAEMSDGTHAGPRPHIRRAHWHGFRSGPRLRADGSEIVSSERKFEMRWLPPIPVNLTDAGDLPAVIHPITQPE